MTTDEHADVIARMLRAAGRRAGPPPGSHERIFAAAQQAWLQRLQARRRQRWTRGLAAAASVAALAITGLFVARSGLQSSESAAPIARLERAIGVLEARIGPRKDWAPLVDEAWLLAPGSSLRTGRGSRAGLLLAGGASLRLAESTEIEIAARDVILLRQGRLYVDSGTQAGTAQQRLTVETAAGSIADVGTQFEVSYAGEQLRVRIREGRVIVSRDAQQIEGSAGEQLLAQRGAQFERTSLNRLDPEWSWIESVAPTPQADGRPMSVLLDWVARETGRPIRFESDALAARAARTILHGNIRHLAPLEALGVTLATVDLDYTVLQDGSILIRSRSAIT